MTVKAADRLLYDRIVSNDPHSRIVTLFDEQWGVVSAEYSTQHPHWSTTNIVQYEFAGTILLQRLHPITVR